MWNHPPPVLSPTYLLSRKRKNTRRIQIMGLKARHEKHKMANGLIKSVWAEARHEKGETNLLPGPRITTHEPIFSSFKMCALLRLCTRTRCYLYFSARASVQLLPVNLRSHRPCIIPAQHIRTAPVRYVYLIF